MAVSIPRPIPENTSRRRSDRPRRKDNTDVAERSHADPHLLNDTQQLDPDGWDDTKNVLLSMAFAEGSPMHPSYGAGHATCAGGCVTMLKAFFHTIKADGTAVKWPQGLSVVNPAVPPPAQPSQVRESSVRQEIPA